MNTPNFSDIYTLYFEDVYKYLLALCHDEELAEELAQGTFFKAMKSYENFRGDCKIRLGCAKLRSIHFSCMRSTGKEISTLIL